MGRFNQYSGEQPETLKGGQKLSLDELLEDLDEMVSRLPSGRRAQLISELRSESKEGVATDE